MDPKDHLSGSITFIVNDNDIELDKVLNELPANKKAKIINNTTLLITAVKYAKIKCVRCLILNGANIDKKYGCMLIGATYTVLWKACQLYIASKENKQYFEIIMFLIESGADCNIRCSDTYTPLMELCRCRRYGADNGIEGLIQALISHGAERDMINCWGKTAEQEARVHGCYKTADFVRDCQAMPETKGVFES
jgi:ankyrin repeat protein